MDKAQWIDRTALAVGGLMQALTPTEAALIATELWDEIPGTSMSPEEAAEIFAAEAPPLDPGSPGEG